MKETLISVLRNKKTSRKDFRLATEQLGEIAGAATHVNKTLSLGFLDKITQRFVAAKRARRIDAIRFMLYSATQLPDVDPRRRL